MICISVLCKYPEQTETMTKKKKKKKKASIPSVVHRLRPTLSTDRYTSRYNVIVDTTKKKNIVEFIFGCLH